MTELSRVSKTTSFLFSVKPRKEISKIERQNELFAYEHGDAMPVRRIQRYARSAKRRNPLSFIAETISSNMGRKGTISLV